MKPLMLHKKTKERSYIPSLLLHCAAAGLLDVEATVIFLHGLREGSCSSSSSASSTRQIKKIRFIEYQSEQCYHDWFHNEFNTFFSFTKQ